MPPRFGALLANDAISLTLYPGEILALLGENGAGKTTLMNILFGHYAADAGRVERLGQPLQGDMSSELRTGSDGRGPHTTIKSRGEEKALTIWLCLIKNLFHNRQEAHISHLICFIKNSNF